MKKIKIKLPGTKGIKKKNESSFANFSFNTIASMASKKESRLTRYLKTIRERLSWLKCKDLSYSTGGQDKKSIILCRLSVVVFVACCATVLYLAVQNDYIQHFVSESDYAKVENVKIEGLDRVSAAEVYRASGITRFQTSMFDVEAEKVVKNIEQLVWVEDAKVSFEWPSTIEIKIREEVPLAMVHTPKEAAQFHFLNKAGKLFAAVQNNEDIDYPVITGLTELDSDKYQTSLDQVLLFLKKIGRNNPALPTHSVSEIHVDKKGQLVAYLVDYTFPIYIGESDIDKAYKYLVRVLEDVYRKRSRGTSISEIGYIQLDYMKDRVLVSEDNSG